jgi:hypothetical protein
MDAGSFYFIITDYCCKFSGIRDLLQADDVRIARKDIGDRLSETYFNVTGNLLYFPNEKF